MSPKKTVKTTSSKGKRLVRAQHNVITADNDNLSKALADIVPKEYEGTPRYLDVIQWNLEWFGAQKSQAKDKERLGLVIDILDSLNGDLFVLQEIAGPSSDGRYPLGSLDPIVGELNSRGAGDYVVYYTKAGGEQRVAMIWDREWVRAKTDVADLFPVGAHKTADGKDAFGQRTPLYGYFSARVPAADPTASDPYGGGADKFDFQVLGVHLKAMAEGHEQRLESARVLARWLTQDAPKTDSDAMIMGDWNAPSDDKCWAPIHALETGPDRKVHFTDINDPSDYSYLWLANRSTKYLSRIDLTALSLSSMDQVVGKPAEVVVWKPIKDTLAQAGDLTSAEVRKVMADLKEKISDHMPVVTRFYFTK